MSDEKTKRFLSNLLDRAAEDPDEGAKPLPKGVTQEEVDALRERLFSKPISLRDELSLEEQAHADVVTEETPEQYQLGMMVDFLNYLREDAEQRLEDPYFFADQLLGKLSKDDPEGFYGLLRGEEGDDEIKLISSIDGSGLFSPAALEALYGAALIRVIEVEHAFDRGEDPIFTDFKNATVARALDQLEAGDYDGAYKELDSIAATIDADVADRYVRPAPLPDDLGLD